MWLYWLLAFVSWLATSRAQNSTSGEQCSSSLVGQFRGPFGTSLSTNVAEVTAYLDDDTCRGTSAAFQCALNPVNGSTADSLTRFGFAPNAVVKLAFSPADRCSTQQTCVSNGCNGELFTCRSPEGGQVVLKFCPTNLGSAQPLSCPPNVSSASKRLDANTIGIIVGSSLAGLAVLVVTGLVLYLHVARRRTMEKKMRIWPSPVDPYTYSVSRNWSRPQRKATMPRPGVAF